MKEYLNSQIKGATMIEYVLIVGLIAVASIVIMTAVGVNVTTLFTSINTAITP